VIAFRGGERGDPEKALTQLALGDVGTPGNGDRDIFVERARQMFVSRERRQRNFNGIMFGEAAWDMLLALYVTEHSRARQTVSGLIAMAGVPPTTALRWLDFLNTKEQLVTRRPSRTDGRVFIVELTDKARIALDRHLSWDAPRTKADRQIFV
jgi:DNA-binding MarR family transcriptional regulator